jgi:hypothetical protein
MHVRQLHNFKRLLFIQPQHDDEIGGKLVGIETFFKNEMMGIFFQGLTLKPLNFYFHSPFTTLITI